MQNKSAFTFIEVMIAIVVFSVGILTVLKLVTNNLEAMDKNNVKIQATLLAKEGIELAYNLRDSNLKRELSWNCLMNEDMYGRNANNLSNEIAWTNHSTFEKVICDGYFGIEDNLQIGFDPENYVYYSGSKDGNDFDENYEDNRLYFVSGNVNYYSYATGDQETYFARYLSFDEVVEGENTLPTGKILKVESHVLYKKGGNTGEVVFESFIGNY